MMIIIFLKQQTRSDEGREGAGDGGGRGGGGKHLFFSCTSPRIMRSPILARKPQTAAEASSGNTYLHCTGLTELLLNHCVMVTCVGSGINLFFLRARANSMIDKKRFG